MSALLSATVSLNDALKTICERLRPLYGPDAPREARFLLCACLGLEPLDLIARGTEALGAKAQLVDDWVLRRSKGEPLAYLAGFKEFYGLKLQVNEHTLIPRPDSETLVDAVLERFGDAPIDVLDLGTGSGALLLALLAQRAHWQGLGVDASLEALKIAEQNAKVLELADRSRFLHSHWFEAVAALKFDVIVANPPYVAESERGLMSLETQFEPQSALFAANDGMAAYMDILQDVGLYLRYGGFLFFEIGFSQGAIVADLMTQNGFQSIEIVSDLSGHARVVLGQKV